MSIWSGMGANMCKSNIAWEFYVDSLKIPTVTLLEKLRALTKVV